MCCRKPQLGCAELASDVSDVTVRCTYTDVFDRNTTLPIASIAIDRSAPLLSPSGWINSDGAIQPGVRHASLQALIDASSETVTDEAEMTVWLGPEWVWRLVSGAGEQAVHVDVTGARDAESGVIRQWVTIGTSAFGSQLMGMLPVGRVDGVWQSVQNMTVAAPQHLSELWVTRVAESRAHMLGVSSTLLGRVDMIGPVTTLPTRSTEPGRRDDCVHVRGHSGIPPKSARQTPTCNVPSRHTGGIGHGLAAVDRRRKRRGGLDVVLCGCVVDEHTS